MRLLHSIFNRLSAHFIYILAYYSPSPVQLTCTGSGYDKNGACNL